MPFKSQAQRGFLYANHPDVAAEFEAHTPKGAKLPAKIGKGDPMPTVGKGSSAKKFPYTPAGEEKAENYASKSGKKMTFEKPAKGKGDANGAMSKSSAAKQAAAGMDMGKPGPGFGKIAAKAGKEYGSAAQGKAVAGAVFQKMRKAGKL